MIRLISMLALSLALFAVAAHAQPSQLISVSNGVPGGPPARFTWMNVRFEPDKVRLYIQGGADDPAGVKIVTLALNGIVLNICPKPAAEALGPNSTRHCTISVNVDTLRPGINVNGLFLNAISQTGQQWNLPMVVNKP